MKAEVTPLRVVLSTGAWVSAVLRKPDQVSSVFVLQSYSVRWFYS